MNAAKDNVPADPSGKSGAGTQQQAVTAQATARKPGTPKEVPQFRWKIVGYSHGVPLTLLKAVERTDAEAHLERYEAEGYYGDLAIHAIDTKIPLPKNVPLSPPHQRKSAESPAGRRAPAAKRSSKSARQVSTRVVAKARGKSPDITAKGARKPAAKPKRKAAAAKDKSSPGGKAKAPAARKKSAKATTRKKPAKAKVKRTVKKKTAKKTTKRRR